MKKYIAIGMAGILCLVLAAVTVYPSRGKEKKGRIGVLTRDSDVKLWQVTSQYVDFLNDVFIGEGR